MQLPCRLALPALAFAALCATPARAQDSRVVEREYVENEVIPFTGHAGYQSTIRFGEGERIENIAVGESGAWQVTPNRRANLLFLKPASANVPATNMTVVTDRRTYLFQLAASASTRPVFLMQFTYSGEDEPEPVTQPVAGPAMQQAVMREEVPLEGLNFAWSMKGKSTLLPERVFDDGSSVYLSWTQGRTLPAVLAIGPDGKTEGPVNYSAKGQFLVIEGFHDRLILRSGKDSAVLSTRRVAPDQATLAASSE
ncbi:MAG: TrbG/VirB9 family P-type conjugative transfer protein [Novosphingobium sp.]|nr:TrbG/VirB9 family P-type conjugative transfer protein [Novosphingobium sp.]